MELTIHEKELFCTYNLDGNDDAKALKTAIALELATGFENGGNGFVRDLWKAAKYRKIAGLEPHPPTSKLRTKLFYTLAEWFTMIRIFLLDLNGIAGAVGHALVSRLFSFAGLSYGLELLFDFGVILNTTFRPPATEEEKHLTHAERFQAVLLKDNRPNRMANAGTWFTINFICFFLTGGWSTALNVVGFFSDLGRIIYNTWFDVSSHEKLLQNFSQEKIAKINEYNELRPDQKRSMQGESLKYEIKKLEYIESQGQQKIEEVKNNRIKTITIASLIFASALLCAFPLTTGVGISLAIATFALIAENVLEGLGKKLFDLYSKHSKKKAIEKKQRIEEQKSFEMNILHTDSPKPTISNSYVNQLPELMSTSQKDTTKTVIEFVPKQSKPVANNKSAKCTPINFNWMHPHKTQTEDDEIIDLKPSNELSCA